MGLPLGLLHTSFVEHLPLVNLDAAVERAGGQQYAVLGPDPLHLPDRRALHADHTLLGPHVVMVANVDLDGLVTAGQGDSLALPVEHHIVHHDTRLKLADDGDGVAGTVLLDHLYGDFIIGRYQSYWAAGAC